MKRRERRGSGDPRKTTDPTDASHTAAPARGRPAGAFADEAGAARRRVEICAALLAFGLPPGFAAALREVGYQSADPRRGLCAAAFAVAIGILAGIWLPRRIIVRRAAGERRRRTAAGDRDGDALRADVATAIVGVLLLVTGLAQAALAVGTAFAEPLRGVIARNLALSPWLGSSLLWSTVLLAVCACAVQATIALSAVHGWLRDVTPEAPRIARLWIIMACTAALGGVAQAALEGVVSKPSQRAGVALALGLPILLAGLLAASSTHRSTAGRAARKSPPWSAPPATGGRAPVVAGFAAAALTLAFVLHAGGPWPTVRLSLLPLVAAGIAVAAPLGTLIGRRWGASRPRLTAVMFALALAWGLPIERVAAPATAGVVRTSTVSVLAGVALVFAARRAAARFGNIQSALACVGTWSAAHTSAVLLIFTLVGPPTDVPALAAWIGAAIAAATALILGIDARAPRPQRAAAAVAAVLIAGSLLLARPGDAAATSASGAPAARLAIASAHDRTAVCDPLCDMSVATSGADIDFSASRFDAVIVINADRLAGSTPEAAERLLRRCRSVLLAHGRLLVETPTAAARTAVESAAERVFRGGERRIERVRVESAGGAPYEAVAAASDAAAWLAEIAWSPDAVVRVEPAGSKSASAAPEYNAAAVAADSARP